MLDSFRRNEINVDFDVYDNIKTYPTNKIEKIK